MSHAYQIDADAVEAVIFDLAATEADVPRARPFGNGSVEGSGIALARELQRHGVATAAVGAHRHAGGDLTTGPDTSPSDPAPLLDAATRIGVRPAVSAVVVTDPDAAAAARAGGFGTVVAVANEGHAARLLAAGATVVVTGLDRIGVEAPLPTDRQDLPSAAERFPEIAARTGDADLAVFLDYDGVLTPIVQHPDLAVVSEETRAIVADLATVGTVAVVSGRDVDDVRSKVRLPGIYYAGSHGFDIVSPAGTPVGEGRLDRFREYLAPLDAAATLLEAKLAEVPGSQVERKRFAIAVHYRRIANSDLSKVETAVHETAPLVPSLRVTTGKKVFELRPIEDWDKGAALRFLLTELGLDRPDVTPLYLGDDTTDEDAFRVLRRRGIGIVVGRDGPPSHARYALEDTAQVAEFLDRLARTGHRPSE